MGNFDVALSFSADDAWIAKDVSQLLKRYNISTYCSAELPDRAGGQLRKNLMDIYRNAQVNIIIWTNSYSGKNVGTIVNMERDLLWDRHVGKSDYDGLLIAKLGNAKVSDDFDQCLSHSLEDIGTFGLVQFCVSRIIAARTSFSAEGITVSHPEGSEIQRGQMLPCKIVVRESYETDPLGRWAKLGDIQVDVVGDVSKHLRTYLIPSRKAPSYLSHSTLIRERDDCLKIKQQAGREFIGRNRSTELDAVKFFLEFKGVSYPHVYCPEYDTALIDHKGVSFFD